MWQVLEWRSSCISLSDMLPSLLWLLPTLCLEQWTSHIYNSCATLGAVVIWYPQSTQKQHRYATRMTNLGSKTLGYIHSFIHFLFVHLFIVCAFVSVDTVRIHCEDIRESVLSFHHQMDPRWNPDRQAGRRAPLPAKPSCPLLLYSAGNPN